MVEDGELQVTEASGPKWHDQKIRISPSCEIWMRELTFILGKADMYCAEGKISIVEKQMERSRWEKKQMPIPFGPDIWMLACSSFSG